MPQAKTDTEVLAEIEKLQRIKPHIRQYSFFGDDNKAAIQAEIDVLTERMNLEDVHHRFDPCDQYVLESAMSAHDWMTGQLDPDLLDPSDNWTSLVDTPMALSEQR